MEMTAGPLQISANMNTLGTPWRGTDAEFPIAR
jgi:hypothetical protein